MVLTIQPFDADAFHGLSLYQTLTSSYLNFQSSESF